MTHFNEERSQADGGWGWFKNEAWDHICRNATEPKAVLNIYMGLCRISSDHKNAQTFIVSEDALGAVCGNYTRKTVSKHCNELVRLKLLNVERRFSDTGSKDKHQYTLLRVLGTPTHGDLLDDP